MEVSRRQHVDTQRQSRAGGRVGCCQATTTDGRRGSVQEQLCILFATSLGVSVSGGVEPSRVEEEWGVQIVKGQMGRGVCYGLSRGLIYVWSQIKARKRQKIVI